MSISSLLLSSFRLFCQVDSMSPLTALFLFLLWQFFLIWQLLLYFVWHFLSALLWQFLPSFLRQLLLSLLWQNFSFDRAFPHLTALVLFRLTFPAFDSFFFRSFDSLFLIFTLWQLLSCFFDRFCFPSFDIFLPFFDSPCFSYSACELVFFIRWNSSPVQSTTNRPGGRYCWAKRHW